MTTIVCANPLCREKTCVTPGNAEQVLLYARRDISSNVPVDLYYCWNTAENRAKLEKLYKQWPRRCVYVFNDDCFDVNQVLDLVINDYRLFRTSILLDKHFRDLQHAASAWERHGRHAAYKALLVKDKAEEVPSDCESCAEVARPPTYSVPPHLASAIRVLTTRIQDLVEQLTPGSGTPMTSDLDAFVKREGYTSYDLRHVTDKWNVVIRFIREENQSTKKGKDRSSLMLEHEDS